MMRVLLPAAFLTLFLGAILGPRGLFVVGVPAPLPRQLVDPHGQWIVSGFLTYTFRYELQTGGRGVQDFAGRAYPVRWHFESPVLFVVEEIDCDDPRTYRYVLERVGPNHYRTNHPTRGWVHFTRPGTPLPPGVLGWPIQGGPEKGNPDGR